METETIEMENGNNGNGKRKMETENGQKIDIRHWWGRQEGQLEYKS